MSHWLQVSRTTYSSASRSTKFKIFSNFRRKSAAVDICWLLTATTFEIGVLGLFITSDCENALLPQMLTRCCHHLHKFGAREEGAALQSTIRPFRKHHSYVNLIPSDSWKFCQILIFWHMWCTSHIFTHHETSEVSKWFRVDRVGLSALSSCLVPVPVMQFTKPCRSTQV